MQGFGYRVVEHVLETCSSHNTDVNMVIVIALQGKEASQIQSPVSDQLEGEICLPRPKPTS